MKKKIENIVQDNKIMTEVFENFLFYIIKEILI